jgi:hypothetical protein
MASPRFLLISSAFVETATGLSLLCFPDLVLFLLLGLERSAGETRLVGRFAGAALLAIAAACWMGRNEPRGAAQRGLFAALMIYNPAAALLLGWAGAASEFDGVLLWPAVGLHAVAAAWTVVGVLWPAYRK